MFEGKVHPIPTHRIDEISFTSLVKTGNGVNDVLNFDLLLPAPSNAVVVVNLYKNNVQILETGNNGGGGSYNNQPLKIKKGDVIKLVARLISSNSGAVIIRIKGESITPQGFKLN